MDKERLIYLKNRIVNTTTWQRGLPEAFEVFTIKYMENRTDNKPSRISTVVKRTVQTTMLGTAMALASWSCLDNNAIMDATPTPGGNDGNPTEFNPTQTPENASITTATLTEVKGGEERSKVIAKLPKNHPEAENGDESMQIFKIKAGDKSFNFVTYPLSEDARSQKIGEINPDATKTPAVALYIDYINSDGSSSMVRLAGEMLVLLDENNNPTGNVAHKWYYQENFQLKDGLPVNKDEAVLGWVFPGEPTNFLFQPGNIMSPAVYIEGYDKEQVLAVSTFDSKLPPALKVQAILVDQINEEVATYKICAPENFRDCVIKSEDITSGAYQEWLNTLSKPFDPNKIRTDIPLVHFDNGRIAYQISSAPNFTGEHEGMEPFRRDVTAATFAYKGHDYLVLPVEFFNPEDPENNPWVVTILPLFDPDTGHDYSETDIQNAIKTWRNEMNITIIKSTPVGFMQDSPDPFIRDEVFKKFPNIQDNLNSFADYGNGGKTEGDRTALSEPGMAFITEIMSGASTWYK